MNLWQSIIVKLALAKNLQQVHIFGDSLLVIKWNNNEKSIHDIAVHAIAGQLKGFQKIPQGTKITFAHVYRELKSLVDSLSKEGLHMAAWVMIQVESVVRELLETQGTI